MAKIGYLLMIIDFILKFIWNYSHLSSVHLLAHNLTNEQRDKKPMTSVCSFCAYFVSLCTSQVICL